MATKYILEEKVNVPPKVKVSVANGVIMVEGPKGKLERDLSHPRVAVEMSGSEILIGTNDKARKVNAMIGTYRAHILNMLYGVTNGYEYSMKAVFSHFPLKVSVKGDIVLIENYLGEKAPRRAKIVGDTKVNVKGDEITLTGADLEKVGQSAANIERATRRSGYDTRVFQDGIYITKKGARIVSKEG